MLASALVFVAQARTGIIARMVLAAIAFTGAENEIQRGKDVVLVNGADVWAEEH